MLVLSRKSQESVVVGGSSAFEQRLKVTVIEIQGGEVKLGFDIDDSIPVHRAEMWDRILDLDIDDEFEQPPELSQVP